jgi:sorbose reductase
VPRKEKTRAKTRKVSDPEQVQKAISDAVRDFGRIDVFIANAGEFSLDSTRTDGRYNAGMAISKPILEQTLDEYRKQMAINGEPPARQLAADLVR